MIRFLTNGTQFYSFERMAVYGIRPQTYGYRPRYRYRICQYLSAEDYHRGRDSTMWEGNDVDTVRSRWAYQMGRGYWETEHPPNTEVR